MTYIIDTHILIWTLLDPEKLSKNILEAYAEADEVQVSNINFWEIIIPQEIRQYFKKSYIDLVKITTTIGVKHE